MIHVILKIDDVSNEGVTPGRMAIAYLYPGLEFNF